VVVDIEGKVRLGRDLERFLSRSGVATEAITPPANGRAPGWHAGLIVAFRQQLADTTMAASELQVRTP
jgi:hypothetical protein